jgi:hypothetical protein
MTETTYTNSALKTAILHPQMSVNVAIKRLMPLHMNEHQPVRLPAQLLQQYAGGVL